MKVYRTAALTAVWRYMANVEKESIKYTNFFEKFIGFLLGVLDKSSVETIKRRTILIDRLIEEIRPKCIVEIGSGFSCRPAKFPDIKFYQLDLDYFTRRKKNIIGFDIRKDKLDLEIKDALFIVEGVTMYLSWKEIKKLLGEIKKYKGCLIIDFFNKEKSRLEKSIMEKTYKIIFKIFIGKKHLFDFRIENIRAGKKMLYQFGYKNIRCYEYTIDKTLDCLFYADLQ